MKDYCNICYIDKEILETDCNHLFCKSCIGKWLNDEIKNTCPICRKNIRNIISKYIIDINYYNFFINNIEYKYRNYKNLYCDIFFKDIFVYIIFFNYKMKDKVYKNHTGKIYKVKK